MSLGSVTSKVAKAGKSIGKAAKLGASVASKGLATKSVSKTDATVISQEAREEERAERLRELMKTPRKIGSATMVKEATPGASLRAFLGAR